jgi:hypothetical protein
MAHWQKVALWGFALAGAFSLGLVSGMVAGTFNVDGDWKDTAAAAIGAFSAVAGAAALQMLAVRSTAAAANTDADVRRGAVHELVRRLSASARQLTSATEVANDKGRRVATIARELSGDVIAAWHPLSIFSPYADLGSVRLLALLADIDSICRRLERADNRAEAQSKSGEGTNEVAPRLVQSIVERDTAQRLIDLGNELCVACQFALAELSSTPIPEFMRRNPD